MSRRLALTALFLFLLVLPLTSSAQDFAPPAASDRKPEPAIEKKAFDLLETIADQAENLHSPANRVRVECTVADLLWTRDEKRARSLFKSAIEQLIALIGDLDYGDQEVYQALSNINQQRQEIITRLGGHDPEMALTFLRQTRVKAGDARWNSVNETNLEMNLARLLVAKDQARALQIARANLANGVTWNLISFLSELQQKDPKESQALYEQMVARIKDEDLLTNMDHAGSAWNLLSSFQPPLVSEETYRELMTTLINNALAITPANQSGINLAQNLNSQLNSSMPQIEKYAPSRVSELRQWSQGLERYLDPSTRMYQEMNQLSQNGSVDDMLAAASKYPEEYKNQAYQNAAWKAFSTGDTNRARQIIKDLVSDPIQRHQILDQFDNQSLYKAVEENRIAEARQLLGKLRTVEQKVQTFTQLADRLATKGDKKLALELLNEARSFADSAPQNAGQMAAQIQLARSYSSLDIDQSCAILQPVIVKTNELVAAAVVLAGFNSRYHQDGQWTMQGGSNLGNLISNLDQTLSTLASSDFERAKALADQLERQEIRLMIQLDLAQVALGGKFSKPSMGGGRRIEIID